VSWRGGLSEKKDSGPGEESLSSLGHNGDVGKGRRGRNFEAKKSEPGHILPGKGGTASLA